MRWYLADVIEHVMMTLCAFSGHARGCWLLNASPLRRLYWWAVNTRWNDETTQHTACPLCRFDRSQYERPQLTYVDTAISVGSGEAASYQYDGKTGTLRRLA